MRTIELAVHVRPSWAINTEALLATAIQSISVVDGAGQVRDAWLADLEFTESGRLIVKLSVSEGFATPDPDTTYYLHGKATIKSDVVFLTKIEKLVP